MNEDRLSGVIDHNDLMAKIYHVTVKPSSNTEMFSISLSFIPQNLNVKKQINQFFK